MVSVWEDDDNDALREIYEHAKDFSDDIVDIVSSHLVCDSSVDSSLRLMLSWKMDVCLRRPVPLSDNNL